GCCGTTAEHIAALDAMLRRTAEDGYRPQPKVRAPEHTPSLASLFSAVPLRQENSFLAIGERCNANGSKKFRELQAAGDWDGCVAMGKEQAREGSNALDVCTAFVGRDEVAEMNAVVERMRGQVDNPLVIDSTELPVLEAALELYGGKAVLNSINFEDGEAAATARMTLARKFGAAVIALTIDEAGMAKSREDKVRITRRLVDFACGRFGLPVSDLLLDPLTFTICTGNEDDRKLALWTLEAIEDIRREFPDLQLILGLSNVSFGLNPAARHVLNSVMLDHAMRRGLTGAIVHASKIVPLHKIPPEEVEAAEDLIFDRRRDGRDPLQAFMALFTDRKAVAGVAKVRPETIEEQLKLRIVDGDKQGLEADLDTALERYAPLAVINDILLDGMKTVGELFGAGKMQLPFVLQSAETMKKAVAYLEPMMERVEGQEKGTIVLATVKGDVHDIGKNLVDIILTNNGYTVHNIGIKQPIATIIDKAEEVGANAIGMSGLLVKSTIVMRDNLEELNARGLASYPVLLGGAALNRTYVEGDLRQLYKGRVFYCRDAFAGLRVMDQLREEREQGVQAVKEPVRAPRVAPARPRGPAPAPPGTDELARSDVATDVPVPTAPFLGEARVVKGIPVRDLVPYLNESALFRGQWQLRPVGGKEGWRHTLETEARPRLRALLDEAIAGQILRPAVVYGYFPCNGDGNDVVVWDTHGRERVRFTFPRQRRDRRLCIADFFRPISSGEPDVIGMHVVTMGLAASEATARLFADNRYREYLELHGVTVELAEALAEYWHQRVRQELGIAGDDADDMEELFDQGYRGSRYSFGYPACPDLEEQTKLFELLRPERIGVELSEEFQLHPEQSTSAIIVHHPEAKYFNAR
ncbi:MAG: vitamin B12 dependent-methionine synthase activation domain-containing protein, partial [Actinomycetes bacterium]